MKFKTLIKNCNYWQILITLSFIISGGILLVLNYQLPGFILLGIGCISLLVIWFSYSKCKKSRIKWIKG